MELFLHFLLFILNFLQVLELLTFFLIVFLLIIVMKKMKKNDKQCLYQLDSMVIESSLLQSIAIVATDASIKNDITTFILHTHTLNQPLIKMLHHAAFVTSAEAELFAIRCGINQASTKENISKIIVITNSIHVAKSFLIPRLIHFKFMLWLFSRNSVISFSEIQATQQSFGKVLAISTGIFTRQLIVNRSLLTSHLSFHAKRLGTSAGNLNVITFFVIRK